MRWGWILAVACALACAAPAAAQADKRVDCGWKFVPWRLTVSAPLKHQTCRVHIGLHGGWMRTVVRKGKRTLLVLETNAWYLPPGADKDRDTPLPLTAKTQTFWHNGALFRLRVLEQTPATRAVVRSLRFVD